MLQIKYWAMYLKRMFDEIVFDCTFRSRSSFYVAYKPGKHLIEKVDAYDATPLFSKMVIQLKQDKITFEDLMRLAHEEYNDEDVMAAASKTDWHVLFRFTTNAYDEGGDFNFTNQRELRLC